MGNMKTWPPEEKIMWIVTRERKKIHAEGKKTRKMYVNGQKTRKR